MSTEFTSASNSTNQNQNQNTNTSSAFAAALQRARQIAAKINPTSASSTNATPAVNSTESLKRPAEDSADLPEAKKMSTTNNSNGDANDATDSSDSSPTQSAAAIAARVAAAAAVGIQGIGTPGVSLGPVTSKNIKVPDKMVGLIIGRGGEQITRLQAESGCKIQMAPDSGGMPDRTCTLTGSNQSISRAEDMILQVIQSRAREVLPGPGSSSSGVSPISNNNNSSSVSRINDTVKQPMHQSGFAQVEIMIPGPKVGLIIGKGGESIKQLQEKSGAKMVIIQDGPNQQENEKPLRISGEVQRVEHAKALVHELLAEKEQIMRRNRGMSGNSPGYNPGLSSHGSHGWDGDQIETTISVPAGKCGVIIGKGGETIRQINQQTGAFCEIDRKQHPNATEKTFIIRGSRDQIEHAKRLFSEKLNMSLNTGPMNGPMNGPSYGMNSGMQGGGPGGPHSYSGSQWPGAQQYSHQHQQQWHGGQQSQGQQLHGASGAGNPPGGSSQVQINPSTGQPDYSAQWIEYYRSIGYHREAAMIEEQSKTKPGAPQMNMQAAQMQAQQLQMQQASAAQGQQMGMPGQPQAMTAAGVPQQQQQQQQQSQPQVQQQQQQGADQSGQTDYSAQWAVYYRSLGKVKEAEAIEAQMKAKGLPVTSQTSSAAVAGATANAAVPNMYGQQQQAAAMYAYGAANPAAGQAAGFYGGAPQQQAAPANASQYAYPNYAANYGQQQAAGSSESRQ